MTTFCPKIPLLWVGEIWNQMTFEKYIDIDECISTSEVGSLNYIINDAEKISSSAEDMESDAKEDRDKANTNLYLLLK